MLFAPEARPLELLPGAKPPDMNEAHRQWRKLLEDISIYRYTVFGMSDRAAAEKWWELAQRAFTAHQAALGEMESDYHTSSPIQLIMRALPPSRAWGEIDQLLKEPPTKNFDEYDRLLLRMLMAALQSDLPQSLALVDQTRKLWMDNLEFQCTDLAYLLTTLDDWERSLKKEFGGDEERIAAFRQELDDAHKTYQGGKLFLPVEWIPELEDAEESVVRPLLRSYLSLPKARVLKGKSLKLARQVLLESPELLTSDQWAYADPEEIPELYERLVLEIPTKSPETPERVKVELSHINQLLKSGNFEEAQSRIDEIVMTRGVQAVFGLILPDQEEGLEFLEENLERYPALPWWNVYMRVSRLYQKSERAEKRMTELLQKPRLSPMLRQPLETAYITHLIAMERHEEAVEQFRSLLKGPASPNTMMMSFRFSKLGRLAENKSWDEEGLKMFMNSLDKAGSTLLDLVTMALLRHQRVEEAETYLKTQMAKYEANDRERARRSIDENLQERPVAPFIPSTPQVLNCLAYVYFSTDRFEEVMKLVDESRSWQSLDLGSVVTNVAFERSLASMVGLSLQHLGRSKEAIQLAERLIHRNPNKDEGYEILVKAYGKGIESKLEAYLSDRPYIERPLVWKAQVLLEQGKTDEALKLIQKASDAKAYGNHQGARERRKTAEVFAAIHRARGETTEAARYENLVKAADLVLKAEDWERIGGMTQANKLYQEAVKLDEGAFELQLFLSATYFDLGNAALGEVHAKRALDLIRSSLGPRNSLTQAQSSKLNHPKIRVLAEAYFVELRQQYPQDAMAAYLHGLVLRLQGRSSSEAFIQAIRLDPTLLAAHKEAYHASHIELVRSEAMDEILLGMIQSAPHDRIANSVHLSKIHRLSKRWDLAYELEKSLPVTERPFVMYPLKAVYEARGLEVPAIGYKGESESNPEEKSYYQLHEVSWLENLIQLMDCRQTIKIEQLRDAPEKAPLASPRYRS